MSATRAVLVTGAARGIGRAIAQRLSNDGLDVLACDLEPDADGPGVPHAADLATREGNRGAVAAALERFGRLDAIVANAGLQHVAPVEEFDEDKWDQLIAVLLTSPFLLAKHAWPALRESGDGRFVAIASAHALAASPFKSAYVSAKHGVLGLVKTLALEGADDGIAAVAVCPGYVRTPLVERQIDDQMKVHNLSREAVIRDIMLASQPTRRFVEAEEIAGLASYLATDAARSITGTTISIDGGWTAR